MIKRQKISLEGVLIPETFGTQGEVTGYALYTKDEDKYLIHPTFSTQILEYNLRKQVEVFGILNNETKQKTIKAHAITALSNKIEEEFINKNGTTKTL